jgi:hypothetical protein
VRGLLGNWQSYRDGRQIASALFLGWLALDTFCDYPTTPGMRISFILKSVFPLPHTGLLVEQVG